MRIRKNKRIRGGQGFAVRMAVFAGAVFFLAWCSPIVSRAEATGTVIPRSVNIRKQPDQGSEVIGSSAAGKEISIRGQVDASGITWYQVYIDSNTMGYVRADMVEKKGNGDIPTVSDLAANTGGGSDSQESDSSSGAASGGDGAQVDAQEGMDRQYAKTKVQAKVRPDPSTANNQVGSLTPGSQVIVSGKSEGGDGKTWYFVTFTGPNGSEKTGYIRSDLLELGDMLPQEEEPQEEEPQEEESQEEEEAPRNDYELKIETGSDGEEAWYIYDNVAGQKQKLVPLLEASYSQTLGDDGEDTKSIVKQRIVIVVLGVLLALLVIALVIMAFKLRDAYYEDYEDDEDEDEEEDDVRPVRRERAEQEKTVRRREPEDEDEEIKPRRRPQEPLRTGAGMDRQRERRRTDREVTYNEEPAVEENIRPARTRKAKNFLLDDDEFEFEFLNMDDKDLK